MKHDQPQFKLRLPQSLKEQLEAEAAKNDRTLTAEIVVRLHDSLARADLARGDDGLDELISRTVENTLNSMLKAGWGPRSGVVDDKEVDNVTDALASAADKTKAEAKKAPAKKPT